jgi:methionyl aminopeptidase
MITIKTEKEIAILREGGARHAFILQQLAASVKPGISTLDLDNLAAKLILEGGDTPSFLGYTPLGLKQPFPASSCISVNEDIVHGIPNEDPRILKEGDIVSIDIGLIHRGMFTDAAITVPVGQIDAEATRLLALTEKALYEGIKAARGDGGIRGGEEKGKSRHIGDIGYAIEKAIRGSGFSIADDLAGHGVGYKVHEDPYVPNWGKKGQGDTLVPGMVLAIEPIVNEGSSKIVLKSAKHTRKHSGKHTPGYTYRTVDGKRSAHFEHTILITTGQAEILTKV